MFTKTSFINSTIAGFQVRPGIAVDSLKEIQIFEGMPLVDIWHLSISLNAWQHNEVKGFSTLFYKLQTEKENSFLTLVLVKEGESYKIVGFQMGAHQRKK